MRRNQARDIMLAVLARERHMNDHVVTDALLTRLTAAGFDLSDRPAFSPPTRDAPHEKEAPVKGFIEIYEQDDDTVTWSLRLDDDPHGYAIGGVADTVEHALMEAEQARKDELG